MLVGQLVVLVLLVLLMLLMLLMLLVLLVLLVLMLLLVLLLRLLLAVGLRRRLWDSRILWPWGVGRGLRRRDMFFWD